MKPKYLQNKSELSAPYQEDIQKLLETYHAQQYRSCAQTLLDIVTRMLENTDRSHDEAYNRIASYNILVNEFPAYYLGFLEGKGLSVKPEELETLPGSVAAMLDQKLKQSEVLTDILWQLSGYLTSDFDENRRKKVIVNLRDYQKRLLEKKH